MEEDRRVQIIRNKEFLKEYLYERGLSTEIIDNPRYEAILWKLSNMIYYNGMASDRAKAAMYINQVISIDEKGSLIMVESGNYGKTLVTSKYEYDIENSELKRFRVETGPNREIMSKTISIYNEDGIEETLSTEEPLEDGDIYFSKATRVKNRIDVIEIQRMIKKGEHEERLPVVYQQRFFWAAFEDISPDLETIDPLEREPLLKFGMPPIYEDFDMQVLAQNKGNIYPLPESAREAQLKKYQETNKHYGRTKAFEKGIAKALVVKDKGIDYNE